MKTYENQSEAELVQRIQEYMDASVSAARGLEIRNDATLDPDANMHEADRAIYPFTFTVDGIEMRGAFTNGDPIWEEDDEAAFQEIMGE